MVANREMNMNIIIVEDDLDIAGGLETGFKFIRGVKNVHIASSVSEALEAMYETEFNLVVTDYNLPGGMNGIELVTQCKQINPNLIIFMLSGRKNVREDAIAAGITKFFLKGGDIDLLYNEVEKLPKKS